MVTKKKRSGQDEAKSGRFTVVKLKVHKEMLKDLTSSQQKQVKGGAYTLRQSCG